MMRFDCDETNTSGIINYFNLKKSVEKDVEVLASSYVRSPYFPSNIVDHTKTIFHSGRPKADEDEWVMVKLIRSTLEINKYAIRSSGNGVNMLINWRLDASLDGFSWETIGEESNRTELKTYYVYKSFECQSGLYTGNRNRGRDGREIGRHFGRNDRREYRRFFGRDDGGKSGRFIGSNFGRFVRRNFGRCFGGIIGRNIRRG